MIKPPMTLPSLSKRQYDVLASVVLSLTAVVSLRKYLDLALVQGIKLEGRRKKHHKYLYVLDFLQFFQQKWLFTNVKFIISFLL